MLAPRPLEGVSRVATPPACVTAAKAHGCRLEAGDRHRDRDRLGTALAPPRWERTGDQGGQPSSNPQASGLGVGDRERPKDQDRQGTCCPRYLERPEAGVGRAPGVHHRSLCPHSCSALS